MSAPRDGEFLRGWPVLLGSVTGIAAGLSSIYFYSLGIFIKPLAAEFDWSRGEASLGALFGTLAAAAFSPLAGRAADRFGSLAVAVVSLLALAAGLAAHGWWIAGLGSFLVVTVITNAIAIGSSPLPYTRLIAARFIRHRGLALGLALAGTGIGAMLIPALLTPYVATHGWRQGYLALAITALVTVPVVGLLLARAREQVGTAPARLPLRQLAGHRGFVPLGLIFFLSAIAVLGTVVQFVPMLSDAGLAPAQAGKIAGLIGLSAMVGRLLIGFMLDRMRSQLVTAGVLAIAAGGMLLMAAGGTAMAVPGALVLGFAIGAEVDLLAFHTARYFPSKVFGQANGTLYGLFLIGGGIGPVLGGALFDWSGSYQAALVMAAILLAVTSVIGLRLPPSVEEMSQSSVR